MDHPTYDEDVLIGPFIGFVLGTALFGLTILQASQYYFRFPNDSFFSKIKVGTVCALDVSHFIFSVALFYANFVSVSSRGETSVKNDWRLKAGSLNQTLLIILVQIIYLHRIYTLSNIPALNNKVFRRVMNVVILVIGVCSISVGVVFCYSAQNINAALVAATDGNLSWVIYLGYGGAAGLDAVIALLTCFILHKNRRAIGFGYISRRNNRLLLSFFTYSLATGILTALSATLVIALYLGQPTTVDYLAVTFITTRLYTNSLLSFVQNIRQQLNSEDTVGTIVSKAPTDIVFQALPHFTDVETTIASTREWSKTSHVLGSGLDSESDIKSRGYNLYSPYYSPLQARKLKVQELEGVKNIHQFSLSPSLYAQYKGSISRRSSF